MALKKLTLTDDHLRLINEIHFEEFAFDEETRNGRFGWGIDQYNLFGGTYVMEDVSRIIGKYDEHIVGTEEDPQGVDFSDELKDYMWGLYRYIWDNMGDIISLVLYMSNKGGITAGTYKKNPRSLQLWTKVD